jgi:seryl-tRNA synthetase
VLDLKWIRENPHILDKEMCRRGLAPLSGELLAKDEAHRAVIAQLQALQSERNALAKSIGQAKAQGENPEGLIARSLEIKELLPALEMQEQLLARQLHDKLAVLPNLLDAEVPDGLDETANKVLRYWGQPRDFSFPPKRHDELGEALGFMSFAQAAKLAGARFVVLKDKLALLERALANFMIDLHVYEFGYTLVSPPLLVRSEVVFGTGQLPKFGDDLFKTTDERWLIPTAEVPVTNLVREDILEYSELPLRFVCFSPCFRSEAGAAGRDTRGMIRQHQFYKVELVSIVHPETSEDEHQRMLKAAETVLQRLEIPYRVVLLCAGDTSSAMRKTYDLEVWLPGEQAYREISSCSNAGDFQARRMNARFREKADGYFKAPIRYLHTLNGSGVAVGRALIAVLENYQQADGSIVIPPVLRPYMRGLEVITGEEVLTHE